MQMLCATNYVCYIVDVQDSKFAAMHSFDRGACRMPESWARRGPNRFVLLASAICNGPRSGRTYIGMYYSWPSSRHTTVIREPETQRTCCFRDRIC